MAERTAPEVLLDDAVSALLAGRPIVVALSAAADTALEGIGEEPWEAIRIGDLIEVARELKELPAESFRRRLGGELDRLARTGSESGRKKGKKVGGDMELTVAESAAAVLAPHLVVRDAAAALEFYRTAFGATELMRLTEPGSRRIGHAEMRLGGPGGAMWMLADEYPEYGVLAPSPSGTVGVRMNLSVPDVDAFVARAGAAGAKITSPPRDEFYGDRASELVDPFGHVWKISTRKENVSSGEMQRRFEALLAGQPPAPAPSASREAPAARPGFHAITPYLQVRRPAELIDFVQQAFGAVETMRTTGSAGGVHAEVRIGDSMVMIGGMESLVKETPAAIYLYLTDVDGAYERALAAGATSLLPPTDQDYGDRNAWVQDRFGNTWYIARHKS